MGTKAPTTAAAHAPKNRTSDNGSFRIDMQLNRLGLGRLQMASGTTDPAEFKRIKRLLNQLRGAQDTEMLRAVRDRVISISELQEAFRKQAFPALREQIRQARNRDDDMQDRAPLPARPTEPAYDACGVRTPVVLPPAPVRAEQPDDDDDDETLSRKVLQQPFWTLLSDPTTWSDSKANADTRKRYQQVLRAFRLCLGLARLPQADLEMLATLPEAVWDALTQVQRRGISISAARAFVDSGAVPRKHKQKRKPEGRTTRAYSMATRRAAAAPVDAALTRARLGRKTMLSLRLLLPAHWHVLEACDERVPDRRLVLGVTLLPDAARQMLTELAAILQPSALTQELRRTRAVHWRALLAAWNRSAADWNHLRRALSAALTCAFGYYEHPTRLKLMRRFPKRPEPSRVSAVDYETFQRILAFVPALYRPAFRTLLQTGLRLGEFLRLQPAHLNRRTRIVNVPGTKTDDSAHPILVNEDFWEDLVAAVPCPVGESGLYNVWRTACAAAGVTDARQHDLRHSFGQWSLGTGVQDSEVQQALRQKSSNITADYRRLKQSKAASTGLADVMRKHRAADAASAAPGVAVGATLSEERKVPQSDEESPSV